MKFLSFKILPALLILAVSCCTMYKKIPNTVFQTSHGIKNNGSVFFLLKYYMYYAPAGIARFPDGGQAKIIFERYFLMKETGGEIHAVHEFDFSQFYKILFRFTSLKMIGGDLYIKIKYYDKNSIELKEKTLCFNIKENSIKPAEISVKFTNIDEVSITETAGHFKKIYDYNSAGLPDPVKYISTRKEADVKTIIRMEGNRLTRLALTGKYINENDIETLNRIYNETDETEIKEIIEPFIHPKK